MRALIVSVAVMTSVIALGASYSLGYWRAQKLAEAGVYDRLLLDLANNILISDAIEMGNAEAVRPVLRTNIETDFFRMVWLYHINKYDQAEMVRCAISRRFRKLKESGRIVVDEGALEEAEMSPEVLNDYLATQCSGEPSHETWVGATR